MVKLIFYGGVNEIGGNKILVEDKDTKIFLDFGMSFAQSSKYFSEFLQPRVCSGLSDLIELGIIPDLKGIYRNDLLKHEGRPLTEKIAIDAVFLSHAHADHSWNISLLHPEIPIFCGETTKLMLKAAQETSRGLYYEDFYTFRECFVDRKKKPEKERNFKTFRTGDKIKIKDIEIEPIHVDHCLSPDTLIQLPNGEIKKVSEVNEKEQILSFDFNSNKLIFSDSEKSVLKANSLLKIKTSLGEIKATPEHKFICLNGLEFVERKGSELKPGDYIIYFKQIPFSGKQQDLPEFRPRTIVRISIEGLKTIKNKSKELNLTQKQIAKLVSINHKFYGAFEQGKYGCSLEVLEKLLNILNIPKQDFLIKYCKLPRISIPTKTSPDFCRLLGYMIGDGSWDSHTGYINIADKDSKTLKLYSKIVERLFSFKPKTRIRFRKGVKLNILLLPTFIANFVLSIDPHFFDKSPKRKIPAIIQKVSLEELASFLSGLYDAEGSVGEHSIVLTSTSKELIDVVKLLLLRFGIISWVEEFKPTLSKGMGYRLTITNSKSIKIFKERIGFGSKVKQQKLEVLAKKVGNTAAEKIDLIPLGGKTIRKILNDIDASCYFLQKCGININHFTQDKHVPSRSFLKRFVDFLKQYSEELKLEYKKELKEKVDYYIEKLEKIIFSPFLFLKIKSIEVLSNDGEMWTVYDFYVPKYNNLIANGFLVHNSIPGAYGFLVHTSAGCIAYSGDIRMHGPKKDMTEEFIQAARKARPEALILEGTNIDNRIESLTENQVFKIVEKLISKTKNLVLCDFPIRDVDRLKTFFQAAKNNGRKIVTNMKQAYLIELLNKEDKRLELPSLDEFQIFIHKSSWGNYEKLDYYNWQRKFLDYPNTIKAEDLAKQQDKFVLYMEFFDLTELLDIKPQKGSLFIHSLTEPFNEEMALDFNRMLNWLSKFQIPLKHAHASGHADAIQLKKIVEGISPKKIFPVHTERPDLFVKLMKKFKVAMPELGKEIELRSV